MGTQLNTSRLIFLSDADKTNGGLYVYSGSHKFGLFDADKKISYRESDGSPGNKISDSFLKKFEKIECSFKKRRSSCFKW